MITQQIINGITLGSTYALLALGYNLIFGVLSFINFAHGDVAMVGAYIVWYTTSKLGIGFLPSCIIAVIFTIIIGVIIEKIGYKPIRHSPKLSMIIVSMGFSFILSTAVQVIWGTEPQQIPSLGKVSTYKVGSVLFNSTQIWILILAFLIMIVLTFIINKTKIGTTVRAVSLDRDTSELMGVNINNTISFIFALGSGIGAISAIMMSTYYSALYSTMGNVIGTKAFAAVVLGGVGSIPGAMLGGLLIGVIESLAGAVFNAQIKDAVSFIVLIAMLLFKPAGILGKEVVKE